MGTWGFDCQAGRWAQENLAVGEGKWCPEQKADDAQRVTEGARHQPYLPLSSPGLVQTKALW